MEEIALVTEAAGFPEMFVSLYQVTRRHIKEENVYYNSIIILIGGAGIA